MDLPTVIAELQKVLADLQALPDPALLQAKVAELQTKIDAARAALT